MAGRSSAGFVSMGRTIGRQSAGIERDMGRINRGVAGMAAASLAGAGRVGRGFGDMGRAIATGAALGVGGLAAFAGIGALDQLVRGSVQIGSSFDANLTKVGTVLRATDQEMRALRGTTLDLGASTEFTSRQVAAGAEILARNGLQVEQILAGSLETTLAIASAAGSQDLALSGDILTDIQANFADVDLTTVANQITGTLQSSKIDLDAYGLAIGQVAGVASTFGGSFEDMNTALAATASRFASGVQAGTGLRAFLTRMVPATDKAADFMADLGIITESAGNRFFDASGRMQSFETIAQVLNETLGSLNDEARTEAISRIFGVDAARTVAGLIAAGAVDPATGRTIFSQFADSIGEADAAAAATRNLDNLQGDFLKLQSAVEATQISLSTLFEPALRRVVGGQITPAVQRTNDFIKSLTGLRDAFQGVEGAAGGVVSLGALTATVGDVGQARVALGDLFEFTLDGAVKTFNLGDFIEIVSLPGTFSFNVADFVVFERLGELTRFNVNDLVVFEALGEARTFNVGDFVTLQWGTGVTTFNIGDFVEIVSLPGTFSFNVADFVVFERLGELTRVNVNDLVVFEALGEARTFNVGDFVTLQWGTGVTTFNVGNFVDLTFDVGTGIGQFNVGDFVTLQWGTGVTTFNVGNFVDLTFDVGTGIGQFNVGDFVTLQWGAGVTTFNAGEFVAFQWGAGVTTFNVGDFVDLTFDTGAGEGQFNIGEFIDLTVSPGSLAVELGEQDFSFDTTPIETAVFSLSASFAFLRASFEAGGVRGVANTLIDLGSSFSGLAATFASEQIAAIRPAVETFGSTLSAFVSNVSAIDEGDQIGRFATIGDSIRTGLSGLAGLVDLIDGEAIGQKLSSISLGLGQFALGLSFIRGDLFADSIAGLSDLSQSILQFSTDLIEGIDFDAVGLQAGQIASSLQQGIVDGLTAEAAELPGLAERATEFASSLATGLVDASTGFLEGVDFTTVAADAAGLAEAGLDSVSGAIRGLDGTEISRSAITFAARVGESVLDLAGGIFTPEFGANLVGAVGAGLEVALSTIEFGVEIFAGVGAAIGDALGLAVSTETINAQIAEQFTAFSTLGTKIGDSIAALVPSEDQQLAFDAGVASVGELSTNISTAVSGLGEIDFTTFSSNASLFSTNVNAAFDGIDLSALGADLAGQITGIGDSIAGALTSFVSAIRSAASAVGSFLADPFGLGGGAEEPEAVAPERDLDRGFRSFLGRLESTTSTAAETAENQVESQRLAAEQAEQQRLSVESATERNVAALEFLEARAEAEVQPEAISPQAEALSRAFQSALAAQPVTVEAEPVAPGAVPAAQARAGQRAFIDPLQPIDVPVRIDAAAFIDPLSGLDITIPATIEPRDTSVEVEATASDVSIDSTEVEVEAVADGVNVGDTTVQVNATQTQAIIPQFSQGNALVPTVADVPQLNLAGQITSVDPGRASISYDASADITSVDPGNFSPVYSGTVRVTRIVTTQTVNVGGGNGGQPVGEPTPGGGGGGGPVLTPFRTGTFNFGGGLARVGEGNNPELIITPDGRRLLALDDQTLNLPAGSQILSTVNTRRLFQQLLERGDLKHLSRSFAEGGFNVAGGAAFLAEKGREMVLAGGNAFMADKPGRYNIPAGSSILPNSVTERILSNRYTPFNTRTANYNGGNTSTETTTNEKNINVTLTGPVRPDTVKSIKHLANMI